MSWHVSSSGKCTTHKPNESRARASFWLRIYRFLLFSQSKTTASINTYTKLCIHSTSSMEWVWETEYTNANSRSRMSDVPHLKHLKIRHLFSLLLLGSVWSRFNATILSVEIKSSTVFARQCILGVRQKPNIANAIAGLIICNAWVVTSDNVAKYYALHSQSNGHRME